VAGVSYSQLVEGQKESLHWLDAAAPMDFASLVRELAAVETNQASLRELGDVPNVHFAFREEGSRSQPHHQGDGRAHHPPPQGRVCCHELGDERRAGELASEDASFEPRSTDEVWQLVVEYEEVTDGRRWNHNSLGGGSL
jgi:hypothetical protein